MKHITKEWLKFAGDDLNVVRSIIKIPHLTNMVAFHSHQAVEKSLKALIEEFDLKFKRIHNLETLHSSVKSIIKIEVDEEDLRELNEVYISARYPGDLGLLPDGKPTEEDARRFFDIAQNVYDDVNAFLKDKSPDIDDEDIKQKQNES